MFKQYDKFGLIKLNFQFFSSSMNCQSFIIPLFANPFFYNILVYLQLFEMQGNSPSTPKQKQDQLQGHQSSPSKEEADDKQIHNQEDVDLSQGQKPSSQVLEDMIICRICDQPIVAAAQTFCGHSFCEICLLQYFLVLGDCPICKSPIRDKKYYGNKTVDNFIEGYIEKLGAEEIESFRERKEKAKQYKQQKNLKTIQPGVYIDVRDDNFVWKKGIIIRTFNKNHKGSKVKFFNVRYLNTQKKQQFCPTSSRIARQGFYTSREDIPKMQKGQIVIEDKEDKNLYILPKDSVNDDSSEQAKSC